MSGIPLNIDFQQILLHLVNVVVLFAIIYFLLYKPVKNFMDKRKKDYQDQEDTANNKLKEAENLKADYEARLKDAEDEIRVMKAEASKAMNERAIASEEQAKNEAAQIISRAKVQAESEKNKILDKAGEQVTDIAREAAKKVIFDNSSDAFDSFLKTVEEKK